VHPEPAVSTVPARPDSAARLLESRLSAEVLDQRSASGAASDEPLLPAAVALFLVAAAGGSLLRLSIRLPELLGRRGLT
jgi:hypothetical protein